MFDYTYWGNETFSASVNMAIEEFLLKQSAKERNASIRFFSFNKDSIVLAYGQDTDVLKSLDNEVELTRRITGGSHVQQGPNALSYTFVVPRDGTFSNLTDMRAYYADIIGESFQNLGIEDVEVDNKVFGVKVDGKIAASHAIFWGVESALLHGIIIVKPYEVEKIANRIWLKTREVGGKKYTEEAALRNIPAIMNQMKNFAPNATPEQKHKAVNEAIASEILRLATRGKFERRRIDDEVFARLQPLMKEKYNSHKWIHKRHPPFVKEEVEEIPGEKLAGRLKKNLPYCLWIGVKDHEFRRMAESD